MSQPPKAKPASSSVPHNPAEIAREAFRRLAMRRIAPTPEAYRDIYNEVAGIPSEPAPPPMPVAAPEPVRDDGAAEVLATFTLRLADTPGDVSEIGLRLRRTLKERDWHGATRLLGLLLDRHVRKGSAIELLGQEAPDTRLLREMLSRTLGFAVAALLSNKPALAAEAEALAESVKGAAGEDALQDIAARLKQLCYQIEVTNADMAEQQEMLLRLFRLLLENVTELLDDDNWMRGQIAAVQALIAGPIEQRALEDAMRSLKDVIYRQGKLKHNLADVKQTVRNMMTTFMDRLGTMAASTDGYQSRMGGYTEQIGRAGSIAELNEVMEAILRETRAVQADVIESRDRMVAAHRDVQEAEERIRALEAELREMSEQVRHDALTGTLNRRGLDEVFEREIARSERRGSPLCVALLDVDNFKRLNDTYGHAAGDDALKHLSGVVKDTLRTMDAVARMGGEEFLILLPETTVESAAQTMTRLQRELTKHFFLHDNEKLLITFSAGVALRRPGEDQASLVKRADQAMYQAKHTGKNRVVVAS